MMMMIIIMHCKLNVLITINYACSFSQKNVGGLGGRAISGPPSPLLCYGPTHAGTAGAVRRVIFRNILYFVDAQLRAQPACHVLRTADTIVAFLMLSMFRVDIPVHNDPPAPAPNFPVHFVWSPDFIRLLHGAGNEPIRDQNARD